jgi:hypothetical protein
LQFNNGSATSITEVTASDVNVFDYERHHIVIVFDHTNNNNNAVKLYVDGLIKLTVDLGSYTGTTTNYATSQPTNSETYNQPRLGIGCLITPFVSTALASEPVNTKLYIDEIHWAKSNLTATGVANLYAAMPAKDNNNFYADVFLGSNANMPMPIVGGGNTQLATFLTASANIVQPQVVTNFNKTIQATPITASANMVEPTFFGDNVLTVNFVASYMFASALLNEPVITITIPGPTMTATATLGLSINPYLDPYRMLILNQTMFQTFSGSFYSSYAIGDIDS